VESIFEAIVRHENDHTNLLRNILDRYPKSASVILNYLLGANESPWDVSKYEYTTQSHFYGDDGRSIPDIQIAGPNFRCLIEVKVSVSVPFTKAQLDGYASCFQSGMENHLCYLVPSERRDYQNAPRDRVGANGTKVHYRDWTGLVRLLLDELRLRPDAILLEAATFWEQMFTVVKMTETNMTFLSEWNGNDYIAMRSLERTVDQARKLFDISEFETEQESIKVGEYGFYLKRAKRYELWAGIWVDPDSPSDLDSPLWFGIRQMGTGWRQPHPRPQPDLAYKKYDLWRLGPETWGNPVKLFETISAFRSTLVYKD